MRFLLYVIVIISETSLVIVLTRWDIVNAERQAHVIVLDWVKQKFSLTVNMLIFKVNMWMLAWDASSLEPIMRSSHGYLIYVSESFSL